MEPNISTIDSLFQKAGEYVDTRVDLLKLKAIDKSSDVASSLLSRLAIIMIVLFFAILLNIGIALVLGEMLGKTYYGFFIMAGFYGITGLVFYSFRNKWLKAPISNLMIKKLLS